MRTVAREREIPSAKEKRLSRADGLHSCASHVTAFLGTAPARLGAALAVFDRVLLALQSAVVADQGAEPAEIRSEPRTPGHEGRGEPASLRTVAVKPNALGHAFDVLLAQAGIGTMLAGFCTTHAGFDARSIALVSHRSSPAMSIAKGRVFRGSQAGTKTASFMPGP
jgi:hypothetical protein